MNKHTFALLVGLALSGAVAPMAGAQQKGRLYGNKHLPTPKARFATGTELGAPSVAGTFGITQFLITQFPVEKFGELRQVAAVKSPAGTHYLFKQYYKNQPLYKTELKLNVSPAGDILSVASALHPLPAKRNARPVKQKEKIAQKHLLKVLGADAGKVSHSVEETLFLENGVLYPGVLLTYGSPNTSLGSKEILLDGNGSVRDEYDLITNYKGGHSHSHGKAGAVAPKPAATASQLRFTPVTALVHKAASTPAKSNATSLTLSQTATSTALINGNQQQVELLAAQRNDTFLLQSPYAVIREFDPPARPVAYSLRPDFRFQLGDPGFEQVNVLYHITAWQQHLQQLGFANLCSKPVQVDANGWNGQDQSSYSAFTNTLSFGIGGVEDGQDPQVIIHEYSHAISRSACGTAAVGYERKVLEEANADYFAVSYKKATDSTDWHRIFTWDGHNEFWPGRMAVTEKRYPADLRGDIYTDAVIWTATLMQIQEVLGREVTDKLVLQSMYSYSSYLTLPQAARLLLQADEILYQGAHTKALAQALVTRGILPKTALSHTRLRNQKPTPQLYHYFAFPETAGVLPTPGRPAAETHKPLTQYTPTPVFSGLAPALVSSPGNRTPFRSPSANPQLLNSFALPGNGYFRPTGPAQTLANLLPDPLT